MSNVPNLLTRFMGLPFSRRKLWQDQPIKKMVQTLFPQHEENWDGFVFMQDDSLPHFGTNIQRYLRDAIPVCWTEWGATEDRLHQPWPPDLTPREFHLWGYVKDSVSNQTVAWHLWKSATSICWSSEFDNEKAAALFGKKWATVSIFAM